jgi:hypothetical protein
MKQQRSLALGILEMMESAVAPAMAGADHPAKKAVIEQALADAKAAINDGRLDVAMAAAWNCCAGLNELQIRNHYNSGTKYGQDIELSREKKIRQSGPRERMGISESSDIKTKTAVFIAWEKIAPLVKRSPTKGARLVAEKIDAYLDSKTRKALNVNVIRKWIQEHEKRKK